MEGLGGLVGSGGVEDWKDWEDSEESEDSEDRRAAGLQNCPNMEDLEDCGDQKKIPGCPQSSSRHLQGLLSILTLGQPDKFLDGLGPPKHQRC